MAMTGHIVRLQTMNIAFKPKCYAISRTAFIALFCYIPTLCLLSCFFIFGQPNRALKWVKMTAVSAIFYIISVHKYRMQMEKAYAGNVLLISEVETNGFI